MYDIRQFRPVIYLLVFVGISGFALAAQSPAGWILATTAILLNAWLVHSGRFSPLPRLLANAITLVALLYALLTYHDGGAVGTLGGSPILVIAQFLVILQLVLLYQQRNNRDYAQLLVLSLLLMVAAAISTSKLEFGVLFILYMFLALYACLLFHLKVETDHAKAAIGVPEDKLNPMTLRQDQRYLSRSMRRLTALVSFVSVATAVVIFLFFPRNTGAGMLGQIQPRASQMLTGFSDQVNFQQVAKITQNPEIVAYVKLWEDEQAIEGTRQIYLRGATLDVYTGNTPNLVWWQWQRTPNAPGTDNLFEQLEPMRMISIETRGPSGTLRQEIMLEPTGTETLFAMPGITDIRPVTATSYETKLRYQARDQTLRVEPVMDKTFRYEVYSSGKLTASAGILTRGSPGRRGREDSGDITLMRSAIDPQIEAYARRPSVSGEDANGALAARRPKDQVVTQFDETIAANIARHLMGDEFSYTLDLSDAQRVRDRDPVVAFLYDLKRGHCEYYAGAMTLMCQSLGLQARLVIGFKCDEYNAMTQSYVVRQSHAHAWVEVLNQNLEWVTFDPTSGRDSADRKRSTGLWAKTKQFFDYLEYTWANSVVAYDRDSRANVIQNVETKLGDNANTGLEKIKIARNWLDPDYWINPEQRSEWFAKWSSKLVVALIVLLLFVMAVSVMIFLLERWKLRRRVRRIGLNSLPPESQLLLARQLAFYDDLLKLLARHKINSRPNLTPLEFSESLTFLPYELFDTVRRLTQIFYRVRYGKIRVTGLQQKRLKTSIARIDEMLSHRASKAHGG